VIVVVEGISAAGKTSWCLAHAAGRLIAEASPAAPVPDRATDPEGAARFWVAQNEARWAAACRLDRRFGLAVCDTDPLKLHYAWSLRRIGALAEAQWRRERDLTRAAVAAGRLGFADLYLVKRIAEAEARRRRDGDPHRARRNFDLHVRLAEPLTAWYSALESLLPGRVRWQLPDSIPAAAPRSRGDDLALFDSLIEALARSDPP
jgi:hypothetical protein